MFTELSTTSSPSAGTRPTPSSPPAGNRRAGTMALEIQSAWKFVLAIALGVCAVWAQVPAAAAAALLLLAVVIAARALTVLSADPHSARSLRPREHATWDGSMAIMLAVMALLLAAAGETAGAGIAGVSAVAMAGLRLRTRYVAG